jgi:hypothetical protein
MTTPWASQAARDRGGPRPSGLPACTYMYSCTRFNKFRCYRSGLRHLLGEYYMAGSRQTGRPTAAGSKQQQTADLWLASSSSSRLIE